MELPLQLKELIEKEGVQMDVVDAFRTGMIVASPIAFVGQVVGGVTAAALTVVALKASAVALPVLVLGGVGAFIGGWIVAGTVISLPLAIVVAIVIAIAGTAINQDNG